MLLIDLQMAEFMYTALSVVQANLLDKSMGPHNVGSFGGLDGQNGRITE